MNETRYAVLIGINDYKINELRFCVNDVNQLKSRLIKNCQLIEDNIYPITSYKDKPVNNVNDEFQKALEKIRKTFIEGLDAILFYFSGHGKYEEKTFLEFHEEKVPIQSIYDQLNNLNPSKQIYIIDACHSGFAIDFKSRDLEKQLADYYNQRYIAKAEGSFFMCSCRNDEKSQAFPADGNGVFTKYILEAIDNNSLYDIDNKSLTLTTIHEYALKKMVLNGKYNQTPYLQVASSGYYPFAFQNQNNIVSEAEVCLINTKDANEIAEFLYRPDLNFTDDFRRDLTQFIYELCLNLYEHNYSNAIDIIIKDNTIKLYDYGVNSNDPFSYKIVESGNGLIVYESFFNKYNGLFKYKYEKGEPNTIILEFNSTVFDVSSESPCHLEVDKVRFFNLGPFQDLKFNEGCKEIVIDMSGGVAFLSLSYRMFDFLLEKTKKTEPLIILRMHENDMLKNSSKSLLNRNEAYSRIMII